MGCSLWERADHERLSGTYHEGTPSRAIVLTQQTGADTPFGVFASDTDDTRQILSGREKRILRKKKEEVRYEFFSDVSLRCGSSRLQL